MPRKIITFIIAALITIIALIASSCSPQTRAARHLEKARRHVEKARILDPASVKTDTVYKEIPVAVPVVKVDTVFKDVGDTVEITKDRLKIKYVRRSNTVYIAGECEADTIIKKVPVQVKERVFIRESFWQTTLGKALKIGGILFLLFAGVMAYLRIFTPS